MSLVKGIYIAAIDTKSDLDVGIYNKICGQVDALMKLGMKMDCILMEEKKIIVNGVIRSGKLSRPAYMHFHKYLSKNCDEYFNKCDFVYIRFFRNDLLFLWLIKKLYERQIKVIVEIPTFPYDDEYSHNFKQTIYRMLDLYVTRNMKKYVSFISTTNEYSSIFGIDTIQIRNGIDIDKIKYTEKKIDKNGSINLVGIANISRWHGYDRVIEGLHRYIKTDNNRNVNFYIIGEGPEKGKLESLVENYNLEDNVFFLGVKKGKELDDVLNMMHIGISSLALFRAGGGHDPIKTKELLGRGMPVVLGYNDKLVDMNLPFVIKVSEDEHPIDIKLIVDNFLEATYSPNLIRNYAKENLSWESQMREVTTRLNNIL